MRYQDTDDDDRYDRYDDDPEAPNFQRLKKQTGKPQTVKSERQRLSKEWGRAVNKYHKTRQKNGKP